MSPADTSHEPFGPVAIVGSGRSGDGPSAALMYGS